MMQAVLHTQYGSPQVLDVGEVEVPTLGDNEVLVSVRASAVTQGDRRLRSSDFPGISWLPGRLMFGLWKPKHRVPGTMFAGRIQATGAEVTRFAKGDDVFGSHDHGAQAEYLTMPEDATLAAKPAHVDYVEAAAVPYGAVTALTLLRDLGKIEAGQRVLIIGAAGGVGRFAVQLATHFGAEVTGVARRAAFPLIRELGADHVIDYTEQDFGQSSSRYDIIFDTAGVSSFARCRASLTPQGRYLSLIVGLRILALMLLTSLFAGRRAIFGVALGTREQMEEVRELLDTGVIRATIAQRHPLSRIRDAHVQVEKGRLCGSVVLTLDEPHASGGATLPAPSVP